MALEIEKKYRVTPAQVATLRARLARVGAVGGGVEFEENTLYTGPGLAQGARVLRLRRVGGRCVFTFKERAAAAAPIKRQREEETDVSDAAALAAILEALGYRVALVYEKRRATWRLGGAEVVIDELPFGWFVEIEGAEAAINAVEAQLELDAVAVEHASYPELTLRHGTRHNEVVEARFAARTQSPAR